MMWSDIFEDWPKAESNNGTRTYEFLPSFETFKNATHQYQIPVSLDNVTYITWEDNRSCDNFIRHSSKYNICDIYDTGYIMVHDSWMLVSWSMIHGCW